MRVVFDMNHERKIIRIVDREALRLEYQQLGHAALAPVFRHPNRQWHSHLPDNIVSRPVSRPGLPPNIILGQE
jgi:hypothetical protein